MILNLWLHGRYLSTNKGTREKSRFSYQGSERSSGMSLEAVFRNHRDAIVEAAEVAPFIVFLCGPNLRFAEQKRSAHLRQRLLDALRASQFEVVMGEDDGLIDERLKAFGVNPQDNELEFIKDNCNAVIIIADSPGAHCEFGLFSWHFAHENGVIGKSRKTIFVVLIDEKFKVDESYLNQGPVATVDGLGTAEFVNFDTFDIDRLVQRLRNQRGVFTVDNKRGRPRLDKK